MARKQRSYEKKSCPYCGERFIAKRGNPRYPTKDHVNPRVLGGGPSITVCGDCNSRKGGMPLEDWLCFLREERPRQLPATLRQVNSIRHALFIPKDSLLRKVLIELQGF